MKDCTIEHLHIDQRDLAQYQELIENNTIHNIHTLLGATISEDGDYQVITLDTALRVPKSKNIKIHRDCSAQGTRNTKPESTQQLPEEPQATITPDNRPDDSLNQVSRSNDHSYSGTRFLKACLSLMAGCVGWLASLIGLNGQSITNGIKGLFV